MEWFNPAAKIDYMGARIWTAIISGFIFLARSLSEKKKSLEPHVGL